MAAGLTTAAAPRVWRTVAALGAAVAALIVVILLAWTTFPQPFLAVARIARLLGLLALLVGAFVGWGKWLCRRLRAEHASLLAHGALGAAITATVWGYLAPWWFPDALLAAPWLLVGWLLLALELRPMFEVLATRNAPPADERVALTTDAMTQHRLTTIDSAGREHAELATQTVRPTAANIGRDDEGVTPPASVTSSRVLWFGALVCLLPPLLVALAPPIAIDSLIYHLAIPRQAALYGRLVDMPWLAYSYFPLHAEMLYGLALPLGGGELAQLLHLLAAVAAVVTAARIASRCFGGSAAPWTAVLLAGAPMLNLVAGTAGNDWLVALYVTLALEQHLDAEERPAARWLEAIFLGAAAATKYNALPALVLLLLPLPRSSRSWRRLAAQIGLVLVVALPWYGRNLLLRGNPLYPLLSESPAATALAHFRGEAPLVARLRGYLFEPNLIDEWPGLLLPAAVALALVVLPRRRRVDSDAARGAAQPLHDGEARHRLVPPIPCALVVLALVLALPVLVASPTARSFTPLLLLLAIAGGGALALVASRPAARAALVAVALALLLVQLAAIFSVWQLDGHEPLRVVAGLEDEDDYLRRSQPYLDAYRTLSQHASDEARVLLAGETRAFYLDRPAVWGSVVDADPFAAFAGSPPDPAAASQRLRAAGVKLVYYFPPQHRAGARPPGIRHELEQYVSPELDGALRRMLAEHARPVFHQGNNWIFALRGGDGAAPPPRPQRGTS
ncbi:MAG TPA: hypothetical protein VGS57_12875 [Thermoanaerobaculia bacterium]|jgi:hypothetical protein|nr:hypothetical protein [Thermoanaerobaculia bacterium]